MALDDVAVIIPMGLMVDAHVTPVDHVYFEPADRRAGRDRYEVRALADGFITNIQRRTQFVGDPGPNRPSTDEYRMVFEHTCTFFSYYDLVTSLAPQIAAQVGTITGTVRTRIPVRAGEVVGKIGGQTLDLGVVDTEVVLPGFVVPSHYDREPWKVHTVDPFDYFDEPLRSQLLGKNPRTAAPRGGKIDYDVDGRLVGNWFKEQTNGYAGVDRARPWDGHLAVVYDHLDPSHVVVSIGDFGGRSRQFGVKGNRPDPATVGVAPGPVRYDLVRYTYIVAATGRPWDHRSPTPGIRAVNDETGVEGAILLQLLADRQLRVQVFAGQTAPAGLEFGDAAIVYER